MTSEPNPERASDGGRGRLRVAVDLRCLEQGEIRGFARYTLELTRALSARPGLELIGIAERAVPFPLAFETVRLEGRRQVAREQMELPRLLRRRAADVLLCPANRGLPAVSPCPSVLTLHDTVEWDRSLVRPPSGRSAARFAYASLASLAGATLVLTVSEHSARSIRERLLIAPGRLRVVPEAAAARFHEDPGPDAVAAVRTRYRLPEQHVLYLGGFDAKKDVATLVRAMAELGPGAPPLVLAGSALRAEPLRTLSRSLGLADRVHFPGFVEDDDLQALYRSATCFVFPALAEGFGLPVLEAMAAGLPTAVARAGALPELVGSAAALFPPQDHRGAAAAIRRLLDPAERPVLVRAAQERARSFSWERTAASTEAVLRDAAATPPSRRAAEAVASLRAVHRWLRR